MRTKLRKIRLDRGYTQQKLANAVNIDRTTYTNIENGKKNPSLTLAIKIKEILCYEKDDIFFDTKHFQKTYKL